MKTILAGLAFAALFFICGCKKDDAPAPVAPKLDTLATGWKKIIVNPTENFADIFFNNNTTGYLAGNETYKSVDGGLSWNVISPLRFANLAATATGNAFFAGSYDSIYKLSNGSNTLSGYPIKPNFVGDVFFVDDKNGYYYNTNGLFNTDNGGESWAKVALTGFTTIQYNRASMFFANKNTGYIIINDSSIYKTDGSILNWVPASFTGSTPNKLDVVFATPNSTVYAASQETKLYKSIDAGRTFSEIKTFWANHIYWCDIHFVDDNTGYVSVDNKIYKTTNAGLSWDVVVTFGGDSFFWEIHFTDAHHGWACGSDGIVMVYNN